MSDESNELCMVTSCTSFKMWHVPVNMCRFVTACTTSVCHINLLLLDPRFEAARPGGLLLKRSGAMRTRALLRGCGTHRVEP